MKTFQHASIVALAALLCTTSSASMGICQPGGLGAPSKPGRQGWQQEPGNPPAGPQQQGLGNRAGSGGGRGFMGILNDLNLTPEQRQQLMASRGQRQNMRQVVSEVWEERQKLQDVFGQSNITESDIRTQASALKNALSAAVDAKVDSALTLRKILTPEQFATFLSQMKERHGGGFRGMGGKGQRGQGMFRPGLRDQTCGTSAGKPCQSDENQAPVVGPQTGRGSGANSGF